MVKGGETFFKKNTFYVGTNFVRKIYRVIVLQGLMIRLREISFTKCIFQ